MKCQSCSKRLTPADHAGVRVWLCTSCHHKDGTMSFKESESIEIDQQVADFLRGGGEIQTVDHTVNHSFGQPAKRTRKEQVKYQKRFNSITP
jgi:hypothetical protein